MKKKPSQHDNSLSAQNYEKLSSVKKVSWGKDQTLYIMLSPGKKELARAINSGDLATIHHVLQNMGHNKAEKYLKADEGLWMRVGLMKIATNNSTNKNYDSELLKKLIYIFIEVDRKIIHEAFLGFQICAIRSKGDEITEQFLLDYHEAISTFNHIRKENSNQLPREEAEGPAHNNALLIDGANPSSEDASTVNEQEVQTRGTLSIVSDEEDGKTQHTAQENKVAESSSDVISLLDHMLSWIYQLPEHLQSQIINSSPIKTLITATEKMAAVYGIKTVEALFMATAEPETVMGDTEYTISGKAMISELSIDAIDMNMVLETPIVNGWILPTAMESGYISHTLNELEHFHGYGFDV